MTKPFSFDQFPLFLARLLSQTNQLGLTQPQIDHACYRVETEARYRELCEKLSDQGKLLQAVTMFGREISTFRLARPFYAEGYAIELVELPAPKSGSEYPEGWEHVEFLANRPLEDLLEAMPNLAWKKGAMRQKLNPTLALKLEDGLTAKFHRIPLDEIIRLEQVLGLEPGI